MESWPLEAHFRCNWHRVSCVERTGKLEGLWQLRKEVEDWGERRTCIDGTHASAQDPSPGVPEQETH